MHHAAHAVQRSLTHIRTAPWIMTVDQERRVDGNGRRAERCAGDGRVAPKHLRTRACCGARGAPMIAQGPHSDGRDMGGWGILKVVWSRNDTGKEAVV